MCVCVCMCMHQAPPALPALATRHRTPPAPTAPLSPHTHTSPLLLLLPPLQLGCLHLRLRLKCLEAVLVSLDELCSHMRGHTSGHLWQSRHLLLPRLPWLAACRLWRLVGGAQLGGWQLVLRLWLRWVQQGSSGWPCGRGHGTGGGRGRGGRGRGGRGRGGSSGRRCRLATPSLWLFQLLVFLRKECGRVGDIVLCNVPACPA